MSAEPAANDAVTARLDMADTIVSADEAILKLQQAAGGDPQGRIAVPQIAAVARLARRLKILIARPLLIGGQGYDIRLWVRARPTESGVDLHFSEWQESPHAGGDENAALRAAEIALAPEGAEWRTDAQMRFVQLGAGLGFAQPGDEFFVAFMENSASPQGLATSIATRRAFFGKTVHQPSTGAVFDLSGHPLFDADGTFLGYRGKAMAVEASADMPSPSAEGAGEDGFASPNDFPDFGRRLDLALRRPLGRIIANAETISAKIEGPLRGDYASYASDIADAGRHLMELVDDLADLQAIDRASFTVAREDIDLADIARRAAGLLGVKARDRAIRIEAPRLDESVPAVGEFRRALQITVNLLNNAIRYSPEESTIWLRADGEEGVARLVVADQGRGIALEDQERIFDKFERLGRDDAGGTGLGLYISRRLARAMKGDIAIDSAPGQGARFILTLPTKLLQ